MERDRIHEGMHVYSIDGEKLGKVIQRGNESFLIEKGLFFRHDYLVRYGDVERIDADGNAYLSFGKEALIEPGETGAAGTTAAAGTAARAGTEEVRVPVMEEEAIAQKTAREAGEVRVRKDVVTEEKQVTVPVAHEEVRVERVPASGNIAAASRGEAFQEGEIRVPLREEKVEIVKTPVAKEEVRVTKERTEEPETVSTELRHEEVHVEEEHPEAP